MVEISKETEEKIAQLQLMEQNLQNFLIQKQTFQAQLMEIESALKEIENTDTTYKIVGNVMVKVRKDDLKKDLKHRKEVLELRIKNIEKQEEKVKEKAKKTRESVLEDIKK